MHLLRLYKQTVLWVWSHFCCYLFMKLFNCISFFTFLFSDTAIYIHLQLSIKLYTPPPVLQMHSFFFHNCFCMHISSFIYVYIPNSNVLSPCYITCRYVFRAENLMLANQLICSSSTPSSIVFPLLLCVWLSLCEFFCQFWQVPSQNPCTDHLQGIKPSW